MTQVAILVPVLARPHRVEPLLDSIQAATGQPHTILFIADPDDTEEIAAIAAAERPGVRVLFTAGGYARKIDDAVRKTSEPLIFTGADDLEFHPGWLEQATNAMRNGVQVVGVNDLLRRRRRARHATHFLIARDYALLPCADGTRGPLHEGYHHSFVDDELIATATRRDAYAYAERAIVEHQHWMNRRAPDDDTYRKGRTHFHADRALFAERTRLWT